MSHDPVFDADNPEWTADDFARARSLDAFPALQSALNVKPKRTPVPRNDVPVKKAG